MGVRRGAQIETCRRCSMKENKLKKKRKRLTGTSKRSKQRPLGLADVLIGLAMGSGILIFKDQLGEGYGSVKIGSHREIWRLKSEKTRDWMSYIYYSKYGVSVNKNSLCQAAETLNALAIYNGRTVELHNRVAWYNGDLWYNLSDDEWRAVRISPAIKPNGWEIVANPPLIFRREDHMKAQVEPKPGTSVEPLFDLTNFPEEDAALSRGILLLMFLPDNFDHPGLNVFGPKGSAKTNSLEYIRMTVDPSRVTRNNIGKDSTRVSMNNIFSHNWVPFFDNVSSLSRWEATKCCKAITGEGDEERLLYTNRESVFYEYRRCLTFSSIEALGLDFPDFSQRMIYFEFPFIPKEKRRTKAELDADFRSILPEVLGAIFSALSKAMSLHRTVRAELKGKLERMADFTVWGEACARASGFEKGAFLQAYCRNIDSAVNATVDANLLAQAITQMLEVEAESEGKVTWGIFLGPAEDLLKELTEFA
jgi:hypothetical protein